MLPRLAEEEYERVLPDEIKMWLRAPALAPRQAWMLI